jgi:transposase
VAGRTDPQALAEWAKGRGRDTREPRVNALESRVTPHPRLVLPALWCPIDSVDETMARLAARIAAISDPVEEAVALLETLPGVARHAAERIVAEIGPAMSRVPRAADLASWAGVAPGNHERAGTRASGKTRQGNRLLRTVLTQVAQAAARPTGTSLAAHYRRLAARRGKKTAMLAVAHASLVRAYDMLLRQEPYREAGADSFDPCRPEVTAKRLVQRLEALGYHVGIHQ